MKRPLISILCAIRNDVRFIEATLESVLRQTYPNFEIIVMDGASTDGTVEIVKRMAEKDKRIIFKSEPDKGQWQALDKALAIAKGEFVAQVCGQDGYLNKEWLAQAVVAFEKHSEVSLVWGVPFDMTEDGKLLGPHYAYASFLNDSDYRIRPKPLQTAFIKIGVGQKSVLSRVKKILSKITWRRITMVLASFRSEPIPQKEQWLFYWLEHPRAFPEGNMIMRRNVYARLTVRYPKETMTNAAMLNFSYEFNRQGYLSFGLPLAASFSRQHIQMQGQDLRQYDNQLTAEYARKVVAFKEQIKKQSVFKFLGPDGRVVAETKLTI